LHISSFTTHQQNFGNFWMCGPGPQGLLWLEDPQDRATPFAVVLTHAPFTGRRSPGGCRCRSRERVVLVGVVGPGLDRVHRVGVEDRTRDQIERGLAGQGVHPGDDPDVSRAATAGGTVGHGLGRAKPRLTPRGARRGALDRWGGVRCQRLGNGRISEMRFGSPMIRMRPDVRSISMSLTGNRMWPSVPMNPMYSRIAASMGAQSSGRPGTVMTTSSFAGQKYRGRPGSGW
jgi:hypothetical protein